MLTFLHGKEDRNLKVTFGTSTELNLLTYDDLKKILQEKHHLKSKTSKRKDSKKTRDQSAKAINFYQSGSESESSDELDANKSSNAIATSSSSRLNSSVSNVTTI